MRLMRLIVPIETDRDDSRVSVRFLSIGFLRINARELASRGLQLLLLK